MRILSRSVSLVALLAFAVVTSGCAALKNMHLPGRKKQQPPRAEAVAKPQFAGTIVLVNEDEHFVLIDVGFSSVPRSGTALKAISGGVETGVVAVGEVRRRPFAVADIVSGAPKRGDRVFQ